MNTYDYLYTTNLIYLSIDLWDEANIYLVLQILPVEKVPGLLQFLGLVVQLGLPEFHISVARTTYPRGPVYKVLTVLHYKSE